MKKIVLLCLLTSLILLVSGCTQPSTSGSGKGLSISVKTSPPEVFAGSDTSLQMDIENLGERTFFNVRVFLYDAGNMVPYSRSINIPAIGLPERGSNNYCTEKIRQGFGKCTEGEGDCDDILAGQNECETGLECRTIGNSIWQQLLNTLTKADICCDPQATDNYCTALYEGWVNSGSYAANKITSIGFAACSYGNQIVRPGAFASFMCRISAPPSIMGDEETEVIRTKATFVTNFSVPAIVNIMNEDEYYRRKTIGSLSSSPRSFSEDDGNIRIDISFSSDMPIVDRYGQDEYMYIDVTNIGNGYLDEIRPQDIIINDTSTWGTAAPAPQQSNSFWDDLLRGHIIDMTGNAMDNAATGKILGFEDIAWTLGLQHGETGCMFDFQCAGSLVCKAGPYLSFGNNLCCNPNENVVVQNNMARCATLAEQNPYVTGVASAIIQPGECDIDRISSPLRPIGDGRHFPRIACRLNLPGNVPYFTNHVTIVTIGYRYELRQEAPVKIMK